MGSEGWRWYWGDWELWFWLLAAVALAAEGRRRERSAWRSVSWLLSSDTRSSFCGREGLGLKVLSLPILLGFVIAFWGYY